MSKKDDDKGVFGGGRLWGETPKPKQEPERPAKVKPEQVESAPPQRKSERDYAAFETQENATRLHIQTAANGSLYPGYHYLQDMRYDHDHQSIITLIFSFLVVEITGENLAPIAHAINYGNCGSIYEFHKQLYDPPVKGATIVEAVKILTEE